MKRFLQFCVFLYALLFPILVLADMPMVLMYGEEIMFMRRAGQEASEHYANEHFFDRQWIEKIEIERKAFTNFQTLGINSGGRNLHHGFFQIDWDSSENHLGRYSEPGFKIEKSEVVQYG